MRQSEEYQRHCSTNAQVIHDIKKNSYKCPGLLEMDQMKHDEIEDNHSVCYSQSQVLHFSLEVCCF